jgi:hypothetical protein
MTIETSLHPGKRCVFLRAGDDRGVVQLLAFVAANPTTLEVWQTPDERKVPPRRTGTFRERLDPLRIASLLVRGGAGAHLDARFASDAVVEGVDEDEWENVLRSAWAHDLARSAPDLDALLGVEPGLLDECLSRFGADQRLAEYAELATHVAEGNREWVMKWRAAIEGEVRSRVELYASVKAAGEVWPDEREIRSFVEFCVLKLGRLPRDDEDATRWDGKGLRVAGLTSARRQRIGLDVTSQIGRYRVRVSYLSAIEAYGWDFDQGGGWYLHVMNPHPDWRFNDPVGPHLSPEDAIEDSGCLAEQE